MVRSNSMCKYVWMSKWKLNISCWTLNDKRKNDMNCFDIGYLNVECKSDRNVEYQTICCFTFEW